MVTFANDVALVVVAKDINEVEYLGDESIEAVAGWLSRHGRDEDHGRLNSIRRVEERSEANNKVVGRNPGN